MLQKKEGLPPVESDNCETSLLADYWPTSVGWHMPWLNVVRVGLVPFQAVHSKALQLLISLCSGYWGSEDWYLSLCPSMFILPSQLWSRIPKVEFITDREGGSSMELMCKKGKAATTLLSFALLLAIIFSCLQFHFYPNPSTWKTRWQLFQTQVMFLNTQTDQKEQNFSCQRLSKPEEITRSDIFGKHMAEVFRRRVEQVGLDSFLYSIE